jgi:hypothetical protein
MNKQLKKSSRFIRGHLPWNTGKKRPEITGEKNPMKKLEARKKLSISMRGNKNGIGSKHTKEWKQKQSLRFSGEKSSFWRGGISFLPYSVDWTKTLKRAIRERDNYVCQKCSQYGNVVHHIDGVKTNCNSLNLITLCRRCHRIIHTRI